MFDIDTLTREKRMNQYIYDMIKANMKTQGDGSPIVLNKKRPMRPVMPRKDVSVLVNKLRYI